jgi:hypothetical protein
MTCQSALLGNRVVDKINISGVDQKTITQAHFRNIKTATNTACILNLYSPFISKELDVIPFSLIRYKISLAILWAFLKL